MVVIYSGPNSKSKSRKSSSSLFNTYSKKSQNDNKVVLKKISNDLISEDALDSIVGFRLRSNNNNNKIGFNLLWGLVSKQVEKSPNEQNFEIDIDDKTKFLDQIKILSQTIVKNIINKATTQKSNTNNQTNFVINVLNEGDDFDLSSTIKSEVTISNALMEDDSFHEENALSIITTLNSELRKNALLTFENHLETLKNRQKSSNVIDSLTNPISSNNDDGDADVLDSNNNSHIEKVNNLVEVLRKDDQTIKNQVTSVKTLSQSLKTSMSAINNIQVNVHNTGNNAHIRMDFNQLVNSISSAVRNTSIASSILEDIESKHNFSFSNNFKNTFKEKILNQSNTNNEHETASNVIRSILSPINNSLDTISSFFKMVFTIILFVIVIVIFAIIIFFFFRK